MLNPEVNVSSPNEATEDRVKRLLEVQKNSYPGHQQDHKTTPSDTGPIQSGGPGLARSYSSSTSLPNQQTKSQKIWTILRPETDLSVAFKLTLPAAWGVHNTFHASLLSPYHETPAHGPNFLHPPPDLINEIEEYEVEKIVDHQYHGRKKALQYLLKWKGYPESDNTWEPADQIHAPDLVKEYHQRKPLTQIKEKVTQLKATPSTTSACAPSTKSTLISSLENLVPTSPFASSTTSPPLIVGNTPASARSLAAPSTISVMERRVNAYYTVMTNGSK